MTTTSTTISVNSSTAVSLKTRSQRSVRRLFSCSQSRRMRPQW